VNFIDSEMLKDSLGKKHFEKIFDDGDKAVNQNAVLLIVQASNAYVYGRIRAQYSDASILTDSPGFIYLRTAALTMAKGESYMRSPEYARRYILGDTKQEMKLPFDLVDQYITMAQKGGAILTSNGVDILESQAADMENLQDKPSIFGNDDGYSSGSWM
jgi:hypothetical protein